MDSKAMDPFGIPQKINRHVFKAIGHYTTNEHGSSFMQIFQYVKMCNKNSKIPTNLRYIVRTSLENFKRCGIIHKDANNRYRIRCPVLMNEMVKMEALENIDIGKDPPIKRHDVPSTSKRPQNSNESLENDIEIGVVPRVGNKKKVLEKRKGKKLELPRARKYRSKAGVVPKRSAEKRPPAAIIPHGKIEEHRKTQRGLNFDDCSTGEPGADDRDSGDEFHVHSMASLDRTDEIGQLRGTNKSATSLADEAWCRNYCNEIDQDEVSKINFMPYS